MRSASLMNIAVAQCDTWTFDRQCSKATGIARAGATCILDRDRIVPGTLRELCSAEGARSRLAQRRRRAVECSAVVGLLLCFACRSALHSGLIECL